MSQRKNRFQRDLDNLKRSQYFLYLLIFSLVTVIAWVGISLLQSQKSNKIDPVLRQLAKPLNPNLDQTLLEELETHDIFSEDELNDFPIYKIIVNQDGTQEVVTLDVFADTEPIVSSNSQESESDEDLPTSGLGLPETDQPTIQSLPAVTPSSTDTNSLNSDQSL